MSEPYASPPAASLAVLPGQSRIAPTLLGRLFARSLAGAWSLGEDGVVIHGMGGPRTVPYLAIEAAPAAEDGLFWATITLRAEGQAHALGGLRRTEARHFADRADERAQEHAAREFTRLQPEIAALAAELEARAARYLRHRQLEGWLPTLRRAEPMLRSPRLRALADPATRAAMDRLLALLADPEVERKRLNETFVTRELAKFQAFFDTVESKPLTAMQRLACVVNEDANLVLAGAGSGKTSVIVGRAGYLVETGFARPEEILILAFGNKASKETDERIAKRLPGKDGIVAKTFHSLGLDILGRATGRKPSVSSLAGDEEGFGRYLLEKIQALAAADARFNAKVLRYLAAHLTPYAEPASFDTKAGYVRHLKNVDTRTLRGERVKSQEEVAIANYLTLNGIAYEYEAYYKVDTATATRSRYRPDFHLPDYDLYIEHFAIDEKGNTPKFIDQKSYTEGIEWKRNLHREQQTKLIESYSHLFRDGRLFDVLEEKLKAAGVEFKPMSLAEVLAQNADKNSSGNQLTRLLVTFITLLKSSGRDLGTVKTAARAAKDGGRAAAFVEVVEPVLAAYNADLRAKNEVDFNDMINEAVGHLDAGRYRSPYRYLLVDEFQDISLARANLLRALLRSQPEANIFCVGDDWQSIFRFTGSDITLTSRFGEQFGHARIVALDLTFRFNDKISAFASTFVMKNGAQMKKTINTLTTADGPAITLVQHEGEGNGPAIDRCLKEIQAKAKPGATVYFIGRYGFTRPPLLPDYERRYPGLKFLYDTAHASKGKEADYVLVLDVNDGRLGFPSQIVDDPLLGLVLPAEEPYPHAEERRLFYVAVTRARHHTYLLSQAAVPSVFVKEMLDRRGRDYEFAHVVSEGAARELAAQVLCPSCDGRLEQRASKFGEPFYGCTNYPYCEERARLCEKCRSAPMVRQPGAHRCASPPCGHTKRTCPRCGLGELVERKGKYGPFLGCSNFSRGMCTYTENRA